MKVKSKEFEATVALLERVDGVPSVVYGILKDAIFGKEVVWSAKHRAGSKWSLSQDYGVSRNRLIRRLLCKVSQACTESLR